jgi:hypothetical protein
MADIEYELIGPVFRSSYPGWCTLDSNHRIRRDDRVSRVQRADNPMLPVTGVACSQCVRDLGHAK